MLLLFWRELEGFFFQKTKVPVVRTLTTGMNDREFLREFVELLRYRVVDDL